MARQTKYSVETRKALGAGINQLVDIVCVTPRPKGRNVVLDKSFDAPLIMNDGTIIAKEIELQDPYEDMDAQLIREVAPKTNDVADDGTIIAIVLTQAMIGEDIKNLTAGASPIVLKKDMEKATDMAVEAIKEMSKPINSKDRTIRVAVISTPDDEIGTMVVDVMEKVSEDGIVTIKESKAMKTEFDPVEDMQFDRGYLSAYMYTDMDKMEANLGDPYVLIIDKKISGTQDLLPLLEQIVRIGARLLAVVEDVEGETLVTLIISKLRDTSNVVAVRAPGYGDGKKGILQDIAILAGSTVISEELGLGLKDVTMEQLERVKPVRVQKENAIIIDDMGDKDATFAKTSQICKQIEETTPDFDRGKLQEHLVRLVNGAAVICVGATTETGMKEAKFRMEDVLNAAKAAVEEGIIVGSSSAYVHAVEEVGDVVGGLEGDEKTSARIILKTLEAPLLHIVANAGLEGSVTVDKVKEFSIGSGPDAYKKEYVDMIEVGILDPVKAIRSTLQNVTNVASTLLITETAVANVGEPAPAGPVASDMGEMY